MRITDYINALPDVFRKDSQSNNYKLLLLDERLVSGLRDDIEAVQETMDISKATGETLDLYGSIYGQPRGSMTDDQYRVIVMQRAARNRAGGDYNSTVEALANALGVSVTEFKLVEIDSPRQVEVTNLPFSALLEAGLTGEQTFQIIEALLPAGVPLAPLDLAGTFEFSDSADDYDEEKGFGDIEQTIGGYFGLLESGTIDIPV